MMYVHAYVCDEMYVTVYQFCPLSSPGPVSELDVVAVKYLQPLIQATLLEVGISYWFRKL